MKIGLIDVDSHNFPNLPLMKISAYHKLNCDHVEFYDHDQYYDQVYVSKVFTESVEKYDHINADLVVRGGSGYDLENKLPYDIEHQCPDYGLYPDHDFAVGWMSRGCPRVNHKFCITPRKDGKCALKTADLGEFWTGQKDIVLLDQNILAVKEGRMDLLKQLSRAYLPNQENVPDDKKKKASVEFNGGLDVRYLNDEIIEALRRINVREYHFAWDDPSEKLFDKFQLFKDSGLKNPSAVGVYVLTNFWSSIDQDLERIYRLRSLGFMPYVMIYDKQKFVNDRGRWLPDIADKYTLQELQHFKTVQHMQRWANNRKLIKSTPRFEDYENYKAWIKKGSPVPTSNKQLKLVI